MAVRRRGHVDRINSYIVCWPGDEREQIGFDGEVFYLPPMDQIAEANVPGSVYKFDSARNRSGDFVAGTVVVADRHAMIDGNRIKVFDADMFVRWVEQIRGDLLDRGLFIVDMPEEVEEAHKEGRPVYERSQDARARTILEAELFRRRKWEEKGTPPPPSSSEHLVAWAIKHLNERGTTLSQIATDSIVGALSKGSSSPPKDKIETALGRGTQRTPPRAIPAAENTGEGVKLYSQAKNLGVKLLKEELEGLLADEDEAVGQVRQKIKAAQLKLEEAVKDLEQPAEPVAT